MVIEVFIEASGMPVKQRAHVAEMADRHADLADLALGQHVVGVVAGLGRQIEGDRQAGLPLGEILAVKRVGIRGRGMAGIGAEDPGLVAFRLLLAHFRPAGVRTTLIVRCNKRVGNWLLYIG